MPSKFDRALYKAARGPWSGANEGCEICAAGDHRHAARRLGPFTVCRCLHCPILVVPS